jgi:hypothetical protein
MAFLVFYVAVTETILNLTNMQKKYEFKAEERNMS